MKLVKQLDIVSLLLWCILSFNFIENIKSGPILPCLNSIKGPLIYPDDPLFPSMIIDYCIRVNYTPSVLVYAIDNEDVKKAVNCAADLRMNITARSGGHSFEKYGLGGEDNYIVVDMTFINGITIYKTNNTAKIGAGNGLSDIYYKLVQEGFFIPAGSCPSVGIGGHALAGGYGFYSRKYGLACDNIISIEIVNAEGELLQVNKESHDDLFYALRGAGGGSYGIVTHFVFKIHPTPPIVTYIKLRFDIANMTQVYQLFDFYNNVGPSLSDNIVPEILLEKKKSEIRLSMTGLYLGNRIEAEVEINKLLTNRSNAKEPIIPISSEYVQLTFLESFEKLATLSEPPFQSKYEMLDSDRHYLFKAKSFIVDEGKGLNSSAIDKLVGFLNGISCDTFAAFELYGGAINRLDDTFNSFIHREALYCILLITHWTSQKNGTKCVEEINDFGERFQSAIESNSNYQAFIDRDLKNWQRRYYGYAFGYLVKVKAKYDPKNLFKFPQSIPVSYFDVEL